MTPPVFAHGHLRLYLLNLLDERSMHGYELIQALGERFGGSYVPSAGTIYPRLAKLEDEGLVTKQAEGRKTVYAITDAGRAELTARQDELEDIESEVTDSVRRLADEVRASVEAAMKSLRADLAAAAREARKETRQTAHSERPDDDRAQARRLLHDAEAAIAEFRDELRSELRSSMVRGHGPDAETVAELRDGLQALRTQVLGRIRP